MKGKIALFLAAALLAGSLSGCGREEQVIYESLASAQNDGQSAQLVIGAYQLEEDQEAVLEEAIQRYQADFPETEVRVERYASQEKLAGAAASGEADLFQVESPQAVDYAQRGLLQDLMEYTGMWDYEASLTEGARRAMRFMGEGAIYLVPVDFQQDALFYRTDWIEAYNETRRGTERAYVETWEQLVDAAGKLDRENGAGKLAISASTTDEYFDSVLWSTLGQGALADPAAGYFLRGEGAGTVFASDKAPEAVELFAKVMGIRLDSRQTEEEAVEAFAAGEAFALLADARTGEALAQSMPEGSWKAAGIPQGAGEMAVFHHSWWGWGVSTASAHGEKAVHFLSFLTNSDNNTHWAKVCGALPIYKEALHMEPTLLEGPREVEMRMLKDAAEFRNASRPWMYQAEEAFGPVLDKALEDYLQGGLDAAGLLGQLDAYWSEAYEAEGQRWQERQKR